MASLVLRRAIGAVVFVAALAGLLGTSGDALASHYFVADIGENFTELQMQEFARFGLRTTEDVLLNVDSAEARAALSSSTGIPEAELVEVARLCDFLQIEGIGPKAFRLLRASGVTTVEDLASRDAEALHAEIVTVNAVEQITGADPDVEIVGHWILAAAQVPIRVAY